MNEDASRVRLLISSVLILRTGFDRPWMTGAKFGDLALVEYGAVAGAGVEVKPGVIDPVPLGKGGWIAERLGP